MVAPMRRRGKSELHRIKCLLTGGSSVEETESATESKPPRLRGKGEMVV